MHKRRENPILWKFMHHLLKIHRLYPGELCFTGYDFFLSASLVYFILSDVYGLADMVNMFVSYLILPYVRWVGHNYLIWLFPFYLG